jgi:FixJ family two-component response regulator
MMACVHLIDDDATLRTALARLLAAAGYAVHTYAAAGDYLVPEPDDTPGCLLLDLHLPGVDGLQLQAALHRHPAYERPIVFLSGSADVPSCVQAMRAGACEFLVKPVGRDVLLAAVQAAVARDATSRERRERAGRFASLAPRERRVLDGIVAGRPHKQLAADIGVSERTIKVDRARVMERLGVRTLPALVRLMVEAGATSMDHQQQRSTT